MVMEIYDKVQLELKFLMHILESSKRTKLNYHLDWLICGG